MLKNVETANAGQDTKHLMMLTALFDSDFSIDWIVELTNAKVSRVITTLEDAVRQEKLVHRGAGVYYFQNQAERLKLIDKLDSEQIKEYHNQIAELLLRDLPDDENKAITISCHLLHTVNCIERCKYLIKAGDSSQEKFKVQEAFQCYAKVLDDLSNLSGKEVDSLFIETALKYSKISTARHDTAVVIRLLKDALSRTINLADQSSQSLLEMHIAKNEWLMGKHTSALNHFDKGWLLASELDDARLRRSATTFGTFFLYWQGRFKEAVESYEKLVPDVDKNPKGLFPSLATVTLGFCYSQIGQVTQGLGMIDAVRSLSLEREDINLAAYTAGNMGCIMTDIHRIDEAIANMKISGKEAVEANNNWVQITGYLILAYCHYQKGEKKRCLKYFRDFLKKRKEIHAIVNLHPYLLELFWLMEQGKLPLIKGFSLEDELKRTIRAKNIFMKGVAYRYQALLEKSRSGSLKKITNSLEQSIKWLEESGHLFQKGETQLELARVYLQLNDRAKAKELTMIASSAMAVYAETKVPDDLQSLIDDTPVNEQLLKEVLQLGQKITDIAFSKDLLNQVMSAVNRLTGAERCALFILDEKGGKRKFSLRASKNLTSAQINHPDFSSSIKMLDQVVQTGKGLIMGADPDEENAFFANENIRSRICVPMILRNKTIGVLYNDNRLLSSAFKESDLELLSFFAAQATIALDNARAYHEIKQLNYRLSQEKEYYKEEHTQAIKSNDIIGESPAIKQVLSQMEQVAQTEATALILGPTGVGKELIARGIHNHSVRRDKPFIRVHCAALPENLIPSELFGHEKGAFTGANSRRTGRFELADGGTLFLDEIGDISPDIQVRLLRILQTKEFERVGGNETLQSDFRLVTATNKNLENEVKEGRFRADLYYRLNVFPITVPSLKERIEDIPLLAEYFLDIYSAKMRKSFSGISTEEIGKLMRYDWPGNVRELENVIERGTILSKGSIFKPPDLIADETHDTIGERDLSLQETEKRHILYVLNKTGWKIRGVGGAAEFLQIHPSTLHFRMKKLGISRVQA